LALALYGWDRVQGVVPEAPPGLRLVRDDPYVDEEAESARLARLPTGDFAAQLPGAW
jgi:hypothetical protein